VMSCPDSPGFKCRGTSSIAARRIAPHATTLRDRVHAFLKANYPASFKDDEVADRHWVAILSVRPRVAELLHDARVKINVGAALYPFRFRALTTVAQMRGGGWSVEEF
jgi:hypothetical protein